MGRGRRHTGVLETKLYAKFDVSLCFDTVSYGLAVLELSEYQKIALAF